MTRDRGSNRRAAFLGHDWALAFAIGVLVAAVEFAGFLTVDVAWSLRGDNQKVIHGLLAMAHQLWADGHVPLWTDMIWGGYPIAADPTAGAFYPPYRLAFALTEAPYFRALDISTAMHAGFLAVGCVAFLLRIGAGRIGSVLGALLVVLSPQLLWWSTFHTRFVGICWMPWAMLAADQLSDPRRGSSGPLALGSISIAAQLLAGYPQLAIYQGLLCAGWIGAAGTGVPPSTRIARVAALALLAGLLAAVQLAATAHELPNAVRATDSLERGVQLELSPANLASLGDHRASSYLGVPTLLLAGAALATRVRRAFVLTGVALVFALLSAGSTTPLYGWVTQLPGLGLFRDATKFFAITVLATASLAALGTAQLWRQEHHSKPARALAVVLATLALADAALQFGRFALIIREDHAARPRRDVFASLDEAYPFLKPTTPSSLRHRVFIRNAATDRKATPLDEYGTHDLGITPILMEINLLPTLDLPLLNRTYADLGLRSGSGWLRQMNFFGVDRIFEPNPCSRVRKEDRVLYEGDSCVLENTAARPIYEIPERYQTVSSMDQMLEKVTRLTPVPPVLVPEEAAAQAEGSGRLAVDRVGPSAAEFDVTTSKASVLLARISWASGWKATLNGEDAVILRAGGPFMAVRVPQGRHRVALHYESPALAVGIGTCGLWLLVIIALGFRERHTSAVTNDASALTT